MWNLSAYFLIFFAGNTAKQGAVNFIKSGYLLVSCSDLFELPTLVSAEVWNFVQIIHSRNIKVTATTTLMRNFFGSTWLSFVVHFRPRMKKMQLDLLLTLLYPILSMSAKLGESESLNLQRHLWLGLNFTQMNYKIKAVLINKNNRFPQNKLLTDEDMQRLRQVIL